MLLGRLRTYPRTLKKNLKAKIKRMLRQLPGVERLILLSDRMALLEQSLSVLRASVQSKLMLQENRIRSLAESRGAAGHGGAEPGAPPAPAALSVTGLEFLMAHARLPAPPSRVFDPERMLSHGGVDLTSLGYDVCRDHAAAHHSNAWDAILYRAAAPLGSVRESVDAWEQRIAGAMHLLRQGGRLILSVPLAAGESVPEWLGRLAAREMVHARRDGNTWTFHAGSGSRVGQDESLILGIVEKR